MRPGAWGLQSHSPAGRDLWVLGMGIFYPLVNQSHQLKVSGLLQSNVATVSLGVSASSKVCVEVKCASGGRRHFFSPEFMHIGTSCKE